MKLVSIITHTRGYLILSASVLSNGINPNRCAINSSAKTDVLRSNWTISIANKYISIIRIKFNLLKHQFNGTYIPIVATSDIIIRLRAFAMLK